MWGNESQTYPQNKEHPDLYGMSAQKEVEMYRRNARPCTMTNIRQKWAYFLALISVSLGLGPSFAHLLELPNKIGLNEERYFIVQSIYCGWALLAVVVVASLVTTLKLAVLYHKAFVFIFEVKQSCLSSK
jgi:hypothetical protein